MSKDDLITQLEAARLAGVSRVTIWAWLRDGKLDRVVVGGRPFVLRSQVERLRSQRRREGK
jgi:predicted site-specific integrase-resolvase